jgi:hypothetical protein
MDRDTVFMKNQYSGSSYRVPNKPIINLENLVGPDYQTIHNSYEESTLIYREAC